MWICSLREQELQDVDKWLSNNLVKELPSHGHLIFLWEIGIIVVVVALVSELVKYICIGKLIHSSVRSVNV